MGIGEFNWTLGQHASFFTTQLTAAPTKTWAHYSDLTNQTAAGGTYTTGGKALPSLVTAVLAAAVCQFDAGDQSWAAATFTSSYTATNEGTLATAGNCLLSSHDLGGSQAVVSGTLTLQWAATGVFTVTISAAA